MEPMQDEDRDKDKDKDEERSGTLVNGRRFTLTSTQLVIVDSSGSEVSSTRLDEITSIQRGGTDVLIMRGQHDPVSLSFISLGAAQQFERELHGIMVGQMTERPPRRRWHLRGRG